MDSVQTACHYRRGNASYTNGFYSETVSGKQRTQSDQSARVNYGLQPMVEGSVALLRRIQGGAQITVLRLPTGVVEGRVQHPNQPPYTVCVRGIPSTTLQWNQVDTAQRSLANSRITLGQAFITVTPKGLGGMRTERPAPARLNLEACIEKLKSDEGLSVYPPFLDMLSTIPLGKGDYFGSVEEHDKYAIMFHRIQKANERIGNQTDICANLLQKSTLSKLDKMLFDISSTEIHKQMGLIQEAIDRFITKATCNAGHHSEYPVNRDIQVAFLQSNLEDKQSALMRLCELVAEKE